MMYGVRGTVGHRPSVMFIQDSVAHLTTASVERSLHSQYNLGFKEPEIRVIERFLPNPIALVFITTFNVMNVHLHQNNSSANSKEESHSLLA